ncbi:hypothetical protein C2G38_2044447 [Gigaspora rosea]|uniref:Uncharacterized protein n=1 Tax=Gigaspora rosea TaxID=44941 RepID=A0A397UKG4_9GLOM|nr:hypothetical protein C2G38_2044447 [Gigaspora rosea]
MGGRGKPYGKQTSFRSWNASALGLTQKPEDNYDSTSNYPSYAWNKKSRRNTWHESSQYNYYNERDDAPKPWRSNSFKDVKEDERDYAPSSSRENLMNVDDSFIYSREKTEEKCVNVTNPNKSDLPRVITVKISQLSLTDSSSDQSDDVITPITPEQVLNSPIDDSPLLINLDEPQIVPKPVENKISEDIYSLDWEKYQNSIFEDELRACKQNIPQPIRCKLPQSLADFDSLI